MPLTVVPPLSDREGPAGMPSDLIAVFVDPDPAAAIGDAADDPETLLVMASHGRGRIGEMVLGSVAGAVLRQHERPVLLVGPNGGEDASIERVMACVDGSRLAETILPVAERWSRDLEAPLDIVQVVRSDVEAQLAGAGVPAGDVLETSYVQGLARRIGGNTGWETVRDDDPVDGLLSQAGPGTLLAVASHGRDGVGRVVMGSVAMRLVHRSPYPLLVLRPTVSDGDR